MCFIYQVTDSGELRSKVLEVTDLIRPYTAVSDPEHVQTRWSLDITRSIFCLKLGTQRYKFFSQDFAYLKRVFI